jgi:hypothetical protein
MDAPRGLEAAGRQAFAHVVSTLEASGDQPELYADALARYARACDVLAALRRLGMRAAVRSSRQDRGSRRSRIRSSARSPTKSVTSKCSPMACS